MASQATTTPSKLLALQATEAPQQRELSHGLTGGPDKMSILSFFHCREYKLRALEQSAQKTLPEHTTWRRVLSNGSSESRFIKEKGEHHGICRIDSFAAANSAAGKAS